MLAPGVLAQVKGTPLENLGPTTRRLYQCLPNDSELPHPLKLSHRLAETAPRPVVHARFSGGHPLLNLGIELTKYPSSAEAVSAARDRSTINSLRDPYEQLPPETGLGDLAFGLSGDHVRNQLGKDPGSYQSVYLVFVRGSHVVRIGYDHAPAVGALPTGKTWMNGDPVKEVWRLARLVDSRLKALDATTIKARKRKKGG